MDRLRDTATAEDEGDEVVCAANHGIDKLTKMILTVFENYNVYLDAQQYFSFAKKFNARSSREWNDESIALLFRIRTDVSPIADSVNSRSLAEIETEKHAW